MSITSDRANLIEVLTKHLAPLGIAVSTYAPQTVSAKIAWIEPATIVPDTVFGSIKISWQLTITASAKGSVIEQQRFLDTATDAALKAVTEDAANFSGIDEYISIAEPTSGAVYPTVRLTLTSFTSIKGE